MYSVHGEMCDALFLNTLQERHEQEVSCKYIRPDKCGFSVFKRVPIFVSLVCVVHMSYAVLAGIP